MTDFDFFSNSSMTIRKAIGLAFMLSVGLNVLMAGFLMLDVRYSRRDLGVRAKQMKKLIEQSRRLHEKA